jgi:hypothetical protein
VTYDPNKTLDLVDRLRQIAKKIPGVGTMSLYEDQEGTEVHTSVRFTELANQLEACGTEAARVPTLEHALDLARDTQAVALKYRDGLRAELAAVNGVISAAEAWLSDAFARSAVGSQRPSMSEVNLMTALMDLKDSKGLAEESSPPDAPMLAPTTSALIEAVSRAAGPLIDKYVPKAQHILVCRIVALATTIAAQELKLG